MATFNGNNGDNTINGTNNNDTINGNGGDDTLDGRGGQDTINGGTGDDHIEGGTGNDTLHGDADNDEIYGESGDDTLTGDGGNDYLDGGDNNDNLDGGSGNDILIGGNGNDRLKGGGGFDAIYGGSGTDTAVYSGNIAEYDFYQLGPLFGVVHNGGTGADGADVLLSVEKLEFADVTIDLTQNNAPIAVDDSASTNEDAGVYSSGSASVLDNDFDFEGDTLTVTPAVIAGAYGTLTMNSDGTYSYALNANAQTLAQGEVAQDSFSYTVSDGSLSDTGTLTINVTGNNDAPVASPDSATTSENASVLIDVLANDDDVDNGAVLTVTTASAPAGQGTASVVGNQVEYDPGTDFDELAVGESVVVVVSYSIQDEHGASASSTINVTVTGTNDGPVANPDTAMTSENATVLVDVLNNDTDVDNGAVLTVTSASAPAGQGSAAVVGNQVEFDPGTDFDYLAVGESAVVVVNYSIEDEHGASSSSTINITVTGTNDAPTIDAGGTDASGSVTELPNNDPGENTTVHTDSGTIAFDDADVSDTHSASFTPDAGGYLGTFTLDPVNQAGDSVGWDFSVSDADLDSLEEGEVVTQTYTVEIDDGNGGTATQDVTITITGAADDVPPDGTNWYIDNSAVGSANDGSIDDPFTSIAAFNAAQGTLGGPGVGDNVFLLTGTGTGVYAETDGINLLDDQTLTGVATGLVRPTISTTGAGNHGVELAQNNNVSGLDIGTTMGAGISDGGGTVGALTVSDVAKSGSGQIVDIDDGGTVNVTLNSAASTGSAGGAIDLAGLSGSFTVSGATSITGAQTGGGVDVTGSAGLNLAFQGNLTVTTTSATGVNVQNAGSLTVSGGTNSITSTTGIAVDLGSISGGVSLANATITSASNYAVRGTSVVGFSLTDSVVTGGSATIATIGFTGLTGIADLLGNTVSGGSDNLSIVNSAGSLDLEIADSGTNQAVIGQTNLNGNDGVFIQTSGSSSLTLLIDGVDFTGARGDLLHTIAAGSSSHDIVILDSNFANAHANTASGGGGVLLTGGGAGANITVDYRVEGSTFTGAEGTALNASFITSAGAIRGYISGNTVGVNDGISGIEGSSGGGDGIAVGLEKISGAGNASHHAIIVDNEVYDVAFGLGGIAVRSAGGGAANPAVMEAIVARNIVAEVENTFAPFYALVGGQGAGDFSQLGLEMDDNNFTAGTFSNAIVLDQVSSDAHYYFPGYAGSPDGEFNGGTASTDLDVYLTLRGNILVSGVFAAVPGGVDASFVFGVTGDPVQPAWFP